jgi:GT2 family glycosyltransferase
LFEGTSIIIPTYNQLHFLKKCLKSIDKYTDLPYEVIVVDNASRDGTAAYLESLGGRVRFRVLPANMGFSCAVNIGLMMAKGTTIVLLNNDALVTERWLRNMLTCLESDPSIGMVGPVTNFISGEQRIKVPYRRVEDMPAFARRHNHSNPGLWRDTHWLRGFCMLFRRELFEELGYFDEGYELGNFEDNDYNIRVRLSGKRLVIAGDTFIHHFGSVTVRSMAGTLRRTNVHNEAYYVAKWSNPDSWVGWVGARVASLAGTVRAGWALYPEMVVVKGLGDNIYWIEGGQRHPILGSVSVPVVPVSQVDLRRWPIGEPVPAGAVERRWRGMDDPSGWSASLAVLPDGTTYHVEAGVVRRIVSRPALESWRLHLKPPRAVTLEELKQRPEGLPIIPLPIIKQRL